MLVQAGFCSFITRMLTKHNTQWLCSTFHRLISVDKDNKGRSQVMLVGRRGGGWPTLLA